MNNKDFENLIMECKNLKISRSQALKNIDDAYVSAKKLRNKTYFQYVQSFKKLFNNLTCLQYKIIYYLWINCELFKAKDKKYWKTIYSDTDFNYLRIFQFNVLIENYENVSIP